MQINFIINSTGKTPVYKQLLAQIEAAIRSGKIKNGEILPSMNELSEMLDISKETVKKVYNILRSAGLLDSHQGKGFYAKIPETGLKPSVLLIFDKLSSYKQEMFDAFSGKIGDRVNFTILLHNQNPDLLEFYLDRYLGQFDYYIVTPHFALDEAVQSRVRKLLSRIPNRQLIVADYLPKGIQGNFGAVYQDFSSDIAECLSDYVDEMKKYGRVNVVKMSDSLYGNDICNSLKAFFRKNSIKASFIFGALQGAPQKGELYIILNSQAETSFVNIFRKINSNGLVPGRDLGMIFYNDGALYEVLFGGLTSVSTDFKQMGRICAEMILSKKFHSVHCPFKMTRRSSF